MGGRGPTPKPPGLSRTRYRTTVLPADARVSAPPWPLPPDLVLTTRLAHASSTVERLGSELATSTDGRVLGRLRRELSKAEQDAAVLAAQVEHQERLELDLWAQLWRTPQASIWADLAWPREVALYCRLQIRAESGDLKAAAEARQWSDRLGLSPLALLRLRWEVEKAETAEERGRARQQRRGAVQPKPGEDPRRAFDQPAAVPPSGDAS